MSIAQEVAGSLAGVVNTISQGLSTPVKTLSSFVSSIGLTASDLANPTQLGGKITRALAAYAPGGSAGLGHHVLGSSLGRKDPLLTYNWFCVMPQVGKFALPWQYIEEFTAPLRSFDSMSRFQEGRDNKYAGKMSVSNLSIRFYDDATGKTQAYLEAWRNSVMSMRGIVNYPSGYKKPIQVVILDVTRAITVYTLTYYGCWPASPDPVTLVSNASERLIPAQEFSVDEVKVEVRNVPPGDLANAILSSYNGGSTNFPGGLLGALTGSDGGVQNAAAGLYSSAAPYLNTESGGGFYDP